MSDDLTVVGADGIRRKFHQHYDVVDEVMRDPQGAFYAIQRQADRIEKLEAKLAKAVEAAYCEGFLAGTSDGWVNNPRIKMEWKRSKARTTLAELKGETDA